MKRSLSGRNQVFGILDSPKKNSNIALSVIAMFSGLVTGILYSLAYLQKIYPLQEGIVVFLFLLVLAGDRSHRNKLLFVFVVVTAIFCGDAGFKLPPDLIRVISFALLLSWTSLSNASLPPFFILSLMWLSLPLLSLYGDTNLSIHLTSSSDKLSFSATSEIFAILSFGMFHIFKKQSTDSALLIPTSTVLAHVISFASILTATAILIGLLWLFDASPAHFARTFSEHRNVAFTLAVIIFLTPIIIARLLGNILAEYLLSISARPSTSQHGFATFQSQLKFSEFESARTTVQTNISELLELLQEQQSLQKEARSELRTQEEQIKQLLIEKEGLSELFHVSPWGVIIINGRGLIIEASKSTCNRLSLIKEQIIGEHFRVLEHLHPWGQDIAELFTLGITEYKSLLGKRPLRRTTPAYENSVANLALQVIVPKELANKFLSSLTLPPVTDLLFAVFLDEELDTRKFKFELLLPSRIAIEGSRALQLCKLVNDDLEKVTSNLSVSSVKLDNLSSLLINSSHDDKNKAIETLSLLRESEKITRGSKKAIEQLLDDQASDHTNVESNISKILIEGARYIEDILKLESPISIKTISPTPHIEAFEASHKVADVFVAISEHEIMEIVIPLFSLIATALPKNVETNISLAYENIDQETASYLVGGKPGTFARIILTHPASLISRKATGAHKTGSASQLLESPDELLNLLEIQLSRIGGFLSLQSTITKGTTLAIYLPASTNAASNKENTKISEQDRARVKTAKDSIKQALILGSQTDTIFHLSNMLRDLGYSTKNSDILSFAKENSEPVKFEGVGFGDESSNKTLTSQINLNTFHLVVLDVEFLNDDLVEMLNQIQASRKPGSTLVVANPSLEGEKALKAFPVINKPLKIEELEAMLAEK